MLLVAPFYFSAFLIIYSCLIVAFVLPESSPHTSTPCSLSSISSIIRHCLGVCSLSKLIQMWDETLKLSPRCCSFLWDSLFEFPGIVLYVNCLHKTFLLWGNYCFTVLACNLRKHTCYLNKLLLKILVLKLWVSGMNFAGSPEFYFCLEMKVRLQKSYSLKQFLILMYSDQYHFSFRQWTKDSVLSVIPNIQSGNHLYLMTFFAFYRLK